MDTVINDSLFFLFGIPLAYLAVAAVVLVNRWTRRQMDRRP